MDILDELGTIEYDKDIAQRAKVEISMLRGLLAEALDSCDSKHEFGEDLYERVMVALGKGK